MTQSPPPSFYPLSPRMRRRVQQQGRTFYLAALVLTSLLCYSYLRDFYQQDALPPQSLLVRSTDSPNLECRLVKKADDQCSFVKENCPDEEAGLVSYLQFYYCSSPAARPFAIALIILWSCLLFTSIGLAASDFLCINLSTIASILRMSESLTGVTFLAFGNGSPDVFSTFAAMKSNSGSLAVGELIGAAGFITSVVAGSMAIVSPFQVARKSFIRDVGFFAVSASFSLVFLADGSLRLWECVVMVGYYAFYVVFVTGWHWYLGRRRRMRLAETAARLHHHIPEHQELEVADLDDDEESRPASEQASLLRNQSTESVANLQTPTNIAWKLEDLDDDDEVRDRYLATLRSQMRVSRPGRGERRNTITPIRPSLIGALEFRSIMSSLEKKGTNIPLSSPRRYSDDANAFLGGDPISAPPTASYPELLTPDNLEAARVNNRMRAVSVNDASRLRIDTNFLSDQLSESVISSQGSSSNGQAPSSSRPSAALLQTLNDPSAQRPPSPKLLLSPADPQRASENKQPASGPPKSPNFLAPPLTDFRRPDYSRQYSDDDKSPAASPRTGPTLQVPILHTPHPDHSRGVLHQEDFPPYVDSPNVMTPISSRPPSMHAVAPSMSPESTHHLGLLPDEEDEPLRTFSWWPYKYLPAPQTIVSTLFPTLYEWRKRSAVERLLGIVTSPSLFLFRITLPVVEPKEEEEAADLDILTPSGDYRSRSQSRVGLPFDISGISPQKPAFDATPSPHGPLSLSRQGTDLTQSADHPLGETLGDGDWNRWLVFVQAFTAPFFIVSVVWANLEEDYSLRLYIRLVLGSLVFSLIMVLILLATTSPNREPKYRSVFCFLGFLVAIAWISTIANEVVGVLKAFGVVTGMSDAILGLTIFAMGNSVGDWVADVTVAKLGFPVMALSACFGGPMLNILLGIGLGGMYMTIHTATHKHAKHPHKPIHYQPYELEISTTLIISGITLLITLIGLLIVVPLNGWRMDRKIGVGLIAVWAISTTANVIVEVV